MTAPPRLLVSVRSVPEARLAAQAGADFIDLKEPAAGALGGLPLATIEAIVAALRAEAIGVPLSATIGDLPTADVPRIVDRVHEVAACGVDYVKVGLECGPHAAALLQRLAGCPRAVVPVFIADRGVDLGLVADAAALGFPALMLDTADKRAGSLFDAVEQEVLRRFARRVQGAGRLAGLAGALRLEHVAQLHELAPDFAGFRSAVCARGREGALDAGRLHALRAALSSRAARDAKQAPQLH